MTKKELENKYMLARRAYEYRHFDEAYSYYKEILSEVPDDYEATFRQIISRVHISTLSDFEAIHHSLAFEVSSVFSFDSFKKLDEQQKIEVVTNMEREFTNAVIVCEQAVTNHYLEFQSLPNSIYEFRSQMTKLSSACGCFGESIYNSFQNESIQKICVNPLKNAVISFKKSAAGLGDDVYNSGTSRMILGKYTSKIRQFEKDYVNPCYEVAYTPKSNTGSNSNAKKDTSGRTFLIGAAIVSGVIALISFASGGTVLGAVLLVFAIMALIMAPFFVF